jgi:hypothetical protein
MDITVILLFVGTLAIIWLVIHTQLLHERKGEKELRKKRTPNT